MGLMSYFYRIPRYKSLTIRDTKLIEDYFNWKQYQADENNRV